MLCSVQLISEKLHSWLQCGCLLILIQQWLRLINLHLDGLNECSQRDMLVCTADVSASSLLVMKMSLYSTLDTMNVSSLILASVKVSFTEFNSILII